MGLRLGPVRPVDGLRIPAETLIFGAEIKAWAAGASIAARIVVLVQ